MFSRTAFTVFVVVVTEFLVLGWAIQAVGATSVVLFSMATAFLGYSLVRRDLSGLAALGVDRFGSSEPTSGSTSEPPLTDRLLRAVAGMLLIIPGLVTTAVGALLLIPPLRALVGAQARRRIAQFIPSGLGSPIFGAAQPRRGASRRDVFDVDVVRDETPTTAPPELH